MQMFNGISMSALKFGKMFFNLETTSTPTDSQESFDNPQNEQLKKIKKEIDELTDLKSEGSLDTDNDKIDVQWVLNREFAEFLKNNPTTAESLYKAVSELNFESIKDNNVKSSNEEVKTKLISFLEPIVHPVNIKEELTGINSNWWNFYEKNLDKGKDAITKETIVGKINDIFELIWENEADWESENEADWESENIKKYRNTIKNINQVLEHPNPDNTKALQKFILANLDKNKEPKVYDDLLTYSFKKKNPDDPDWLFGQATLNWVHAFLDNLYKHIEKIQAAESIMKNNESIESSVDLKELTVKETIKLSDKIEASALIDNFDKLQDKVEVAFKEGKWIDQLNKLLATPQEVIVVIKSKDWKQTREITINATISGDKIMLEENTTWKLDEDKKTNTSETKSNPVDTKPYESDDGKKYQVMENNAKLVESTKINWATFYFPESKQDVPQNDDGTWETAPDKLVWQEREFYLKLSDKPGLYKVKVDAQWNLYPIMEENKLEGKRILIKNNESCVNYLLNKLPPTLRWSSVKIMWDGEDYVIWKDWYRKWLTIEPMTIDWKWLSAGWESKTSLADSLAFLNFTNFLRNEGEIYGIEFRNNNPDLRIHENELYVRVNRKSNKEESKRNWEKRGELWWKWQKVDLNSFWLPAVENPAFQNFIKYNNHEDWNDNWDGKNQNKHYKKMDISSRAEVLWWYQTSGQVVGHGFYTGPARVWGWSVDVAPAQVNDTSGSTEVTWEVLEQSVLLWLLNWIKIDNLWTMRSSWSWYELFTINESLIKEEWNNKYIEIWWHRFMEATDNFTGLWYKVTVHWVYIWEFKDGQNSWVWIDAPSTDDLSRPTYIWGFEKWLYNWNWKLELDGNSYEWEFKGWLWEGMWKFTWADWNRFEWSFYNPLWEWSLSFRISNQNGSIERSVVNQSNGQTMNVVNFFIGEMKSWTLTLDGKDYAVIDGKYTTESWETKEIQHP